ncbi:ferredoxin [Obba rivulosa]|uniref:Ferredoxin n=1 Tax=Obba rivulosa TaxID=1052685 RepID=A0A8E2AZ14_9APHY|nr:ferredoxin [Obba rivulosa]
MSSRALLPQTAAKMTRRTARAAWNPLARPSLSRSLAFARSCRHNTPCACRPGAPSRHFGSYLPPHTRLGSVRPFHATAASSHGPITPPAPGTGIKVHFKDAKGNLIRTVEANEGDDILSIAHTYDIDLEGACEGSVACSTCHVILDPEHYDLLPEPEDDENDMLDMAFGLTDTSRLGCQVKLTKELDGITATLPSATRNMFVDGKKPTHH